MADAPDAAAIEAKARTLLDERVEKVRALARAQAEVVHVEDRHDQELSAALADQGSAYTAATKAGWNDQELKKLGLGRPPARPSKRSRRSRPKGDPSTTEPGADGGADNG